MERKVDIAIIGAGSAGLSAFKEAKKYTDKVVVIDHGPLGTTCARVGCMPSKVLIQDAEFFHDRVKFAERGIHHADKLTVNLPEVMQHVRKLRDYYTSSVIKYTKSLGDQLIEGTATFLDPNTLTVGDIIIKADKIIIATGSHPVIPESWESFRDCLITSDNIFEEENFPDKVAVIGAGVIGLEMGQALSRLGVEICVFHRSEMIGTLTDPVVNDYAVKTLQQEFPVCTGCEASIEKKGDMIEVVGAGKKMQVKKVLAALGRKPSLESLGLQKIGMKLSKEGLIDYDCTTMQVKGFPIYVAGDVDKTRPLLHEAADEGRIAGFNAAHGKQTCFKRRVPLTIIFTQPNIAKAGQSFAELKDQNIAIGEVTFDDQGRARLMGKNKGIMRIYADAESGKLLGTEMMAPMGEHLAHMLAWAIQQDMTAMDVLRMPYYHPTVQEGMRTALRDLATKIKGGQTSHSELSMCDSEADPALS